MADSTMCPADNTTLQPHSTHSLPAHLGSCILVGVPTVANPPMRKYVPPLSAISLCLSLPAVRPLLCHRPQIILDHELAIMNQYPQRSQSLSREISARRRTKNRSTGVCMMGKPSQPIPRNVKDTVSSLRAAVQEGLKAQQSRMDVDLPFAAQLGVEVTDDKKKKTATMEDVARSDRELARLFIEMFDVIGEQVVVAFPTDDDAAKARNVWDKSTPYKGRVTSMNPQAPRAPKMKRGSPEAVLGFARAVEAKKKQKQKASAKKGGKQGVEGEGGGVAAGAGGVGGGTSGVNRIAPPGTEVLLVVAPKQQELAVVEKLSKELGQGCLIVLLNARLHQATFSGEEQQRFFEQDFESMFHLRPVGTGSEDFVYRAYPRDWSIARKPKIGPPKVLKSLEKRPTEMDIREAVEQGDKAAGVFGNVF